MNIQELARRDGLKGELKIEFRPRLLNGYSPFTKKVTVLPYRCRIRRAIATAHEIKHAIDLQDWPLWLCLVVYWPVILGAGVAFGLHFSWTWGAVASLAAYLFHPLEVRANVYSLLCCRKYLNAFEESETS